MVNSCPVFVWDKRKEFKINFNNCPFRKGEIICMHTHGSLAIILEVDGNSVTAYPIRKTKFTLINIIHVRFIKLSHYLRNKKWSGS